MVMINIRKTELINATENCVANIFSVENFCLPNELLLIYLIFIWLRPRVYIKYGQNSSSSILGSNKIVNFVEC